MFLKKQDIRMTERVTTKLKITVFIRAQGCEWCLPQASERSPASYIMHYMLWL